MAALMREVRAEAQRALDKARGMVRRGLLRLAAASGALQVEGYDGEPYNHVEHWGPWGISSRPPAGADVLMVLVGGDGAHPIAIATAHRDHRVTGLSVGDVAIYAAKDGSDQATVIVRADGSIDLTPGGSETVNVGGDSEALLLGETVRDDLLAFATACKASADATLAAQATTLEAAINAGWLATKGKVT